MNNHLPHFRLMALAILLSVLPFASNAQFNVGGNVSISYEGGIYADIAPAFGYKIKIVNMGFSPFVSYSMINDVNPVYSYGARAFGDITLLKGTFAHGEIEATNTDQPSIDSFGNKIPNRKWILAIPVGMGFNYPLNEHATAYAILLYDLIHDPASPKENPYVRFGINYSL